MRSPAEVPTWKRVLARQVVAYQSNAPLSRGQWLSIFVGLGLLLAAAVEVAK